MMSRSNRSLNVSESMNQSDELASEAEAGGATGSALGRGVKVLVEVGLDGLERSTTFKLGVGDVSSVGDCESIDGASGERAARGRLGPGIGESECRRTAMLLSKALKRSMDSLKWSIRSSGDETRGDESPIEGKGSTPSIGV